ncbi:acetyl/propionyl-CoA carboxylase subuit alpha [Longispora fulva]|uniref:Propionyl-CoA carboxylase alpha chain n=1 Tax=Longispora fulva TaxID=619741 RepID=A0A8J7GGB7_9ACTN|nr:biotin carboxylase N-terminal domain-containing protein [Longispora fulva]MBG6137381.1 propionyl-CoA carboxylase alpha chain [Longispora fulva]GIG61265.1 acetyl/propionyl-CoA carboxylase subuit alpha [Longispora fulva]
MITRLLVANRGEIARRILRTCRDLGIETVAVFSDVDADAPFVAEADLAVGLPGVTPADTYLRGDLIIAAALGAGADAVHPGYGFLSENAEFALRVHDAGLTWVGPSAEMIAAMGSKLAAKKLAIDAGVPTLSSRTLGPPSSGPASEAAPPTPARPVDAAPGAGDEAFFPVLIKADAGGGGRGMRIVHDPARLEAELAIARAEAAAAFGDAEVFVEPYVADGRHIEVQVLADTHGTVWTLGERECSLQRRHQKVIEETPSPFVTGTLRGQLAAASVGICRAIGYTGAGTVEFLVAPTGEFFFLEMNTRLQVEHPVTECVTGLDLVAWQLRIAEGAALPPEPPEPTGHAIEARLYAEDPARDWLPQAGALHRCEIPGIDARFAVPVGFGLRVDDAGADQVSVHYDPMLAKVVAWAPTREEAARRLASALAGAALHGLATNRDLLVRTLRHPEFLAGATDTGFFARHALTAAPEVDRLSVLAAALAAAARNRAGAPVLGGIPSGWRNVPSSQQVKVFVGHEVTYGLTRTGLAATHQGVDLSGVELVSATPDRVVLARDGLRHTFEVATYPGLVCVDSPLGAVTLVPVDRFPPPRAAHAAGSLLAPMPGTVVAVHVTAGQRLPAGALLLELEAMKMRFPVTADADGTLTALHVRVGDQVDTDTLLAVLEAHQ